MVAAPSSEVTGNAECRTGMEKTLIQCHLALEEDDQDLQGQSGEISPTPWVLPGAFSDCAPFSHDHFPGGLKGTLSQGAGRRSKSGGCVMGMMSFGGGVSWYNGCIGGGGVMV